MHWKYFLLTIALGGSLRSIAKANDKIIIEASVPDSFKGDSVEFSITPVHFTGKQISVYEKVAIQQGRIKWIYPCGEMLYVSCSLFGSSSAFTIEPGDSITVSFANERPLFAGRGSEKLTVVYEVTKRVEAIAKPANPRYYSTQSLADYLEWSAYLDRQIEVILPLIDPYHQQLSLPAYTTIRSRMLSWIEFQRSSKFLRLILGFTSKTIPGLSKKELDSLYDATMNGASVQWLSSLSDYSTDYLYYTSSNRVAVYRENGYDSEVLKSDLRRLQLSYERAKIMYHGRVREQLLVRIIYDGLIRELPVSRETEALKTDYYNQPGFPEFKQFIKDYDENWSNTINRKGEPAWNIYGFGLKDEHGIELKEVNFKNKIIVLTAWCIDCADCATMTASIRKIQAAFAGSDKVSFVNISGVTDKSSWEKEIKSKKYTTGNGFNIYTEGYGTAHPVFKAYNIRECPFLTVIGYKEKYLTDPVRAAMDVDTRAIISLIRSDMLLAYDGPYVFREPGNAALSVANMDGQKLTWKKLASTTVLNVPTDEPGKTFSVKLKAKLSNEPSVFKTAEKIFAISDIEGEFGAFRQLLLAGKVIDKNYNWIFGKGHLVLVGDFVDRGYQVTEVLWLVYSLEEKAKAAGGYVHFILGNHEIMNLSGDTSYVRKKYLESAALTGKSYLQLYGTGSELGRWLRTKNIMEKIGDILFVHGGVSKVISDLGLSVPEINELARDNMDKMRSAMQSTDINLKQLFHPDSSPFWFRLYFAEANAKNKPTETDLNSVLDSYQVSRMIVGHTHAEVEGVGKGLIITPHYNNKIINLDTRHAIGFSEGLLIKDKRYYRVSKDGISNSLF